MNRLESITTLPSKPKNKTVYWFLSIVNSDIALYFLLSTNSEATNRSKGIKNKQLERLSPADFEFLLNLLNEIEVEANTEIRIDGDNKSEALTTIKRIKRIRKAVIDLKEYFKKWLYKFMMSTDGIKE